MPARILDDPIPPADFPMELLSEVELDPPVIERRTCELVISGVSCRLPESENMEEFEQHLMNGDDMVSEDNRRWQPGLYGLPKRSGKLKTLNKFDAAFFGVNPKQANRMDPQLRMLLEVTYEAIVDSGTNPSSIRGSKTGVFIGASASEAHEAWAMDPQKTMGYSMTGCTRSMFANRLSYFFDLKGPSFALDTACSSSLLALDQAVNSIRQGHCDAAIVGGCSVCLKPLTALQFLKLGMLSPEGTCKSFDASGNGYCRSEGIVVVYLQMKPDAKRIYSRVVHSKTNSDGKKEQGITFPSGDIQKRLLYGVYEDAGVAPNKVVYVEAHGTGTKAGDPQEVNTIVDVFCKDREGPLPIGSVKSNMGHAEPASGLAAIAKVIIGMEKGVIPANLHYKEANPDIPGLNDGRLQVVTQNMTMKEGFVGVNSFGFGGSNVHVILQSPEEQTESNHDANTSKRLFVYSSRTFDGVQKILQMAQNNKQNLGMHALLNESANVDISVEMYKGFTILNGSDDTNMNLIQPYNGEKRPTWFVFSGMGTQWHGMGRDMMVFDVFRNSILKSDAVLSVHGVKLYDLMMTAEESAFEDTVNSFICIAAIQVALVDTLRVIGIAPDGIVGHSVGELGCAYADGSLTAGETVLAAYWRGRCIRESNLPPGGMAAVGMTWEEACAQCPPGVVPACHNSEDTVTISGPKEAVATFVNQLKEKNVFAKEVNSSGVAFHSYYMAKIAPVLKAALDKVIKPKPRSKKWISSSIPEEGWDSNMAQYSSAEYHVNNLVSPVLFYEALKHIPDNANVIEIAPHCLLQAILKRTLKPSCCNVGLMKRGHTDNVEHFYMALGKCYTHGVRMSPLKLYPAVNFPVPRGTPMISPVIQAQWNHSMDWDVPTPEDMIAGSGGDSGFVTEFTIGPDSPDNFLKGHCIDGRVLFPATGYLVLAWQALAKVQHQTWEEMPVKFSDVMIHKATILPSEGKVKFKVLIMQTTGDFEISESGLLSVSGKIRQIEPSEAETLPITDRPVMELSSADVYKELRLRGYDYGADFRGISAAEINGKYGELIWKNNWISFLDTMLQISILHLSGNGLCLPTRIKSVTINPLHHGKNVYTNEKDQSVLFVKVDKYTDRCWSGGVTIHGLHATTAPRRQQQHKPPMLEKYEFVPYIAHSYINQTPDLKSYVALCRHYAVQSLKNLQQSTSSVIKQETLQTILAELSEECQLSVETVFPYQASTSLLDLLKQQMNTSHIQNDRLMTNLSQPNVLKPALDIVIENCISSNLSVLEVEAGSGCLYKSVCPQMLSHPMMSINYRITGSTDHVTQEDKDLYNLTPEQWNISNAPPNITSSNLIILQNVLHKHANLKQTLQNVTQALDQHGFLLIQEVTDNFPIMLAVLYLQEKLPSIEDLDIRSLYCFCNEDRWIQIFQEIGLNLLYKRSDGIMSSLFLLSKIKPKVPVSVIDVSCYSCTWFEDMKSKISESGNGKSKKLLWLLANSGVPNGVVGMVNCLRREGGGANIRCILNGGKDSLTLTEEVFTNIQEKNLVMNIFRDGVWGSYRHLPIEEDKMIEKKSGTHAYVNVLTRGDLSSLHWVESPLKFSRSKSLCSVSYAALNFRDVMLATGRLPPDAIPGDLAQQDCILGMEFSGYNTEGKKVAGLVPAKGLATHVDVTPEFLWSVPENWTLEQAATVPVVYSTVYYALVIRGRINPGDKVLIHSGSGGVGQAAISVALHHGCEVFTTVGSEEKRKFLKSRFPQLQDDHFCNSRDVSFEKNILTVTKGKGVDVVLNSLSEEKLQASLQVVAQHGRFLEIGKYDLSNNTALGMSIFLKNISFHGILLDALFDENNTDWQKVSRLMDEGIQSGAVQPLNSSVFENDQLEEAFRFMAQGKHIGKVLIKVSENGANTASHNLSIVPRTSCHPGKAYIITGGLGGFGLELSEWLIERGAQCLVLTSRSGIKSGYQKRKLQKWHKKGVQVIVSRRDLQSEEDTKLLVEETSQVKPVGGIFHLAMVLKDGLIENQTVDQFQSVCQPKVFGTMYLDRITRNVCRESLDWFVVFSSVSCGRGNSGQSNYGLANSFMERICEHRKMEGFPGLAIQWGAIGDVGVVLETMGNNNSVIGGTLPQRMMSCLSTLDQFLNRSEPVLSSFIQAESKTETKSSGSGHDVVQAVCNILGVKDVSTISMDVSLGDLGLDSLMGVEIKQLLERDYDSVLSTTEIRQLTIKKLQDLSNNGCQQQEPENKTVNSFRYRLDKMIPDESIICLQKKSSDKTLFLVHPLEGDCTSLMDLVEKLPHTIYGLQCSADVPLDSISSMAAYYLQSIQTIQKSGPYLLSGYSFGACVAMAIATQMEAAGEIINEMILLDGSHNFVSVYTGMYRDRKTIENDAMAETEALCSFVQHFLPGHTAQVVKQLNSGSDFETRVKITADVLMSTGLFPNAKDLEKAASFFYRRLLIAEEFSLSGKLRCPVRLLRASDSKLQSKDSDYGLSQVCSGELKVEIIPGNHETFIRGDNAVVTAKYFNS